MRKDEKRGIALIWALIMCTVLIMVSTIMSNVIVAEIKFTTNANDSLRAYSAARSGIEWAKLYIENEQNSPGGDCTGTGWNGMNYDVSVGTLKFDDINVGISITPETQGTCTDHGDIVIVSTAATPSGINRKIESTLTDTNLRQIDKDNIIADDSNIDNELPLVGSFNLQFDFWKNNAGDAFWIGPGTVLRMGLSATNSSDNDGLFFQLYDQSQASLVYRRAGVTASSSSTICINNTGGGCATAPANSEVTNGKDLRIKIKYFKTTGARMYIYKKNFTTGTYDELLQAVSLNLPEGTIDPANDFKYFYFGPSKIALQFKDSNHPFSPENTDPNGYTDSRYYQVGSSPKAYFDSLMFSSYYLGGLGGGGEPTGPSYTLTTGVNPAGAGTVTPSGGTYPANDTFSIFATPSPGYVFGGWSGIGCDGGIAIKFITMDSDKSCIAGFIPTGTRYNLTITSNHPEAATISGAANYDKDTWATASISNIQPNYFFNGWGGDCISGGNNVSTNVLMNSNKTCSADFTYVSPDSCPINNTTLTSPANGATVDYSSSLDASANNYSLPNCTKSDIYVQLVFQRDPSENGGNTSWNTTSTVHGTDSQATISLPITQNNFTPGGNYWWTVRASTHSDMSGYIAAPVRSFTVTNQQFTMSVSTQPGGSASTSGSGNYYKGKTANVGYSNPKAGIVFTGWSGDCSGFQNPLSLLMNSPKNCIANFADISGGGGPPVVTNVYVDTQFGASFGYLHLTAVGDRMSYSVNNSAYQAMASGKEIIHQIPRTTIIDNGDDSCTAFYDYSYTVRNPDGVTPGVGTGEYRSDCSNFF